MNLSSAVDDVHGARNISNHFQTIYENLYNEQHGISDNLVLGFKNKVQQQSHDSSTETVKEVTADQVKAAIKKLKSDK